MHRTISNAYAPKTFVLHASILLMSTLCGAIACDGGQQSTAKIQNKAVSKVDDGLPPKAVAAATAGDAVKGKELFVNCAACHGPEGEGKIGMGPRLASKSFLSAASDEMLTNTIANGRGGTTMIAWKNAMSSEDITSVVAYLRTLAPHTLVELDESPCKGDSNAGEKLYLAICAACHGRNGAGYSEASSGTGIVRKPFLDSVTNGYLRHIIKNGKDQTQMRSFQKDSPTAVANLSDEEIENVIAYLRKSAW